MKHHQRAFWRSHFAIITFTVFVVGLGTILLSQQASLFALGITALIVAHVAAFGGLFLFGGGWIASKLHSRKQTQTEVDHA